MPINNLAHMLDRFAQPLIFLFVFVAICGWAYGFVAKASPNRRLKAWEPIDQDARFVLGAGVFGMMLGGMFLLSNYINASALEEIRSGLSAKIETVTVNGQPFEKADALLVALRNMADTEAHHSSPGKSFEVIVTTDRGSVTLVLRKDSDNPHEYWVFYPGFRSTQTSNVARAFTDVLDQY
jgi:hypothetical protein